jgi:hypothetical protein
LLVCFILCALRPTVLEKESTAAAATTRDKYSTRTSPGAEEGGEGKLNIKIQSFIPDKQVKGDDGPWHPVSRWDKEDRGDDRPTDGCERSKDTRKVGDDPGGGGGMGP